MALLWMDSFDHYATADLLEKYGSTNGSPTISAANGRRASASLRLTSAASNQVSKQLAPVDTTTVVIGVALKLTSLVATHQLIQILNAAGTQQCNIGFNTGGFAELKRTTTVVTTAVTGAITTNTFYFVECKIVVHPSAGSVIVRINETEVLNVGSLNTAATGVAGWGGVLLASVIGPTTDFDDLYILDGSGSAPLNGFLGDCRVDARYPTAEGASSAWTPLSGTDNALMVDETAPNDDTDYNSTSTVGATDTHVTQDAPVAGALLYGVQLCLSAKKSDAGTCSIAPVVRHSGVDYPGTAFNPGTSYAYNVTPYGTNPGTGAAWTEAGFNAIEVGYKRTA